MEVCKARGVFQESTACMVEILWQGLGNVEIQLES